MILFRYIVQFDEEVAGNRGMVIVAARDKEEAVVKAIAKTARRSGVMLHSANVIDVTGGRRIA